MSFISALCLPLEYKGSDCPLFQASARFPACSAGCMLPAKLGFALVVMMWRACIHGGEQRSLGEDKALLWNQMQLFVKGLQWRLPAFPDL